MKSLIFIWLSFFSLLSPMIGQEAQFPVVSDYGGIYRINDATVLPDTSLEYRIVIDVVSGPDSPRQMNMSLHNVARLMNLHGLGGVSAGQMQIVLAIHGKATDAVLSNEAYQRRHQVENPNTGLMKSLSDAGVRLTVCGQSLLGSGIATSEVNPLVEIALSMLTTVTTHQLQGFAFLRF